MSLLPPRKATCGAQNKSEAPQQVVSAPVSDRYLKLPEVMHLSGYSKSGIYDLMRRGKFPKRIKLSARRSVWRDSEIQAWIRGDFEPTTPAPVISIFGGGARS